MRDFIIFLKNAPYLKSNRFFVQLSTKHALSYITNKIQVFSLYNNLVPKTKIKQNAYSSAPTAILCVDEGK